MNGTVIYVERIKPTDEEFADVLGVVHTTVQLPGRSCVVDSNLNKCGVRHCHGRSSRYARTPPSSFPYISSSGIRADHHGWCSVPAEGVVLGCERRNIRCMAVAPGNVEEGRVRAAQGH